MAVRRNTATLTFPTATGSWGNVTHFGFRTTAGGGTWLGGDALNNARQVAIGATPSFAAQELSVTVPDGEATAAGGLRAANGFISGTVYVTLHNGNPGANGTNEVSGGGYARAAIAANAWS